MKENKINLALLCDFYEFTMSNGYFKSADADTICYFDVFFRKVPDKGGFVIVAGLEQIITYIQNLHFDEEDINFLREQKLFDETFLSFLKKFRFSGDINALEEGLIAFPYEPILSVKARACEAQLLETFILLTLNHQSLIATKASRIVRAANGRAVLEFGSRRAQGIDAALSGARAAFIGGCKATACTLAGKLFGIPVTGTMAHSWVQMFEDEYEAFKRYCELYPQNAVLLVDTYESIQGIKNAIKAFKTVFKEDKNVNLGIRLDSGDLCKLSQKARIMLDEAGLKHCKILVSGNLDEYKIKSLLEKGAKIDAFGVGEKLITAKSEPVLGCVYKLVATQKAHQITPKIKISENSEKITNPAPKKLYRFYDKSSHKALYDKLYLENELVSTRANTTIQALQIPIFQKGKLVYKKKSLHEIAKFSQEALSHFNDKITKLENPSKFKLLLSLKLSKLKDELLQIRKRK
ncbi:nicotinate phosphoribosyltransferase [Campylobacter sp. MIT 97-5078]|nr:nicotinate phosphoribosyltransferase [Campylobacter sp. MIT 97-5078]KGI55774.1 nicotinate phosphoribosyltransferase [Campylobacter sp. MIT 97-5078]TQR27744.1 nicotinate phosphoribosyltransferase [Campylobacter sp. MIT 97-5078]